MASFPPVLQSSITAPIRSPACHQVPDRPWSGASVVQSFWRCRGFARRRQCVDQGQLFVAAHHTPSRPGLHDFCAQASCWLFVFSNPFSSVTSASAQEEDGIGHTPAESCRPASHHLPCTFSTSHLPVRPPPELCSSPHHPTKTSPCSGAPSSAPQTQARGRLARECKGTHSGMLLRAAVDLPRSMHASLRDGEGPEPQALAGLPGTR